MALSLCPLNHSALVLVAFGKFGKLNPHCKARA